MTGLVGSQFSSVCKAVGHRMEFVDGLCDAIDGFARGIGLDDLAWNSTKSDS